MRLGRTPVVAVESGGVVVVACGIAVAASRLTSGSPLVWTAGVVATAAYLAAAVLAARGPASSFASPRLTAYLATTAGVLSGLLLIAFGYRRFDGLGPLLASPAAAVGTLAMLAAFTLLLWRVAAAVLAAGQWVVRRPALAWLTVRSHWALPWILLALTALWAPALVLLAPGSTTYDGTRQINEFIGSDVPELGFTYEPSNHHPWFATLWQGALLSAGMQLSGGDIDGGLLVHSSVLVLASLLTYAYVVARIQALTNQGWTLLAVAFFGIVPHFANYAMLYEKTGWYQLALIWFVLGVVDVALGRGHWAAQGAQVIAGGILTSLFRSNGLYVVVATLLVLAVCLLRRADRRRLLVAVVGVAAVLAAYSGWSSVALPRLGVEPASPGEALVVPFQQTARIVVEEGDRLRPEQRAAIEAIMPLDRIAASYDPENGDGVKGLYEIDSFLITDTGIRKMQERGDWPADETVSAERNAFLATWAQLVLEHPATAVSATLHNTYLYYAPPLNRGEDVSLFTGGLPTYFVLVNEHTDDYRHLAGEQASGALTAYYAWWAATPGLNMLVNPGLYGWAVIALGISLAFWRRRERVMVFAPVALVYLINFAGARNGDFRYTVPLLVLLPICLAAWFAIGRATRPDEPAQAAQDASR